MQYKLTFKTMKRFLLFLLIASSTLSATAQEREVSNLRWSGFATNRFWDNWEISAAGGSSLLQISKNIKDDPVPSGTVMAGTPILHLQSGWFQ